MQTLSNPIQIPVWIVLKEPGQARRVEIAEGATNGTALVSKEKTRVFWGEAHDIQRELTDVLNPVDVRALERYASNIESARSMAGKDERFSNLADFALLGLVVVLAVNQVRVLS